MSKRTLFATAALIALGSLNARAADADWAQVAAALGRLDKVNLAKG